MAKKTSSSAPVFRHDMRVCACGCGRRFRPTPTLGPVSTERYINAHHAVVGLAKRYFGRVISPPADDGEAAETFTDGSKTRPRIDPGGDADRVTAQRGPIRSVVRVVASKPGVKGRVNDRVILDCGHEITVFHDRKKGRCYQCRRT